MSSKPWELHLVNMNEVLTALMFGQRDSKREVISHSDEANESA
ncbi:MAG: hypothetical protein OEQ39_28000 [Gammaproteobacteria bacterium]|nr:hypothetical protein [Gammaproteobacteria bacterium]